MTANHRPLRRLLLLGLVSLGSIWAGQAQAVELGLGVQTLFPASLGLEAHLGSSLTWELAVSGGFLPGVYVDAIEPLAQDEESGEVLQGTLRNGLGLGAQLRLFPLRGFGFFVGLGYELYLAEGTVQLTLDEGQAQQALEDPDTGSDLPPGGGPDDPVTPPVAGGDPQGEQAVDVSSVIHLLRVGVGYRQILGRLYLQAELAVLKAVAASSEPAAAQDYLDQIYTDNLLVPVLGVGAGLLF